MRHTVKDRLTRCGVQPRRDRAVGINRALPLHSGEKGRGEVQRFSECNLGPVLLASGIHEAEPGSFASCHARLHFHTLL